MEKCPEEEYKIGYNDSKTRLKGIPYRWNPLYKQNRPYEISVQYQIYKKQGKTTNILVKTLG